MAKIGLAEVSDVLTATTPQVLFISVYSSFKVSHGRSGKKKVTVIGAHDLERRPVRPAESSQRTELFTWLYFTYLTVWPVSWS